MSRLTLSLAAFVATAGFSAPAAAQQAPAAGPENAVPRILDEIAAAMVALPGGTFAMGDLTGRGFDDEKPVHDVTVQPFLISKYEVTFEQYDAYARATGAARPTSHGLPRGDHPAMNVNWSEAVQFIAWLNEQTGLKYRLPSEAEWEYAARAGSSTDYPWGARFDASMANGNGKAGSDTWEYMAPVGSFPPNAWGLHDMIGNVWEWVEDCYQDSYEGAPADGSARKVGMGHCGPVIRGGGWSNDPVNLRSADRSWHDARFRYYFLGFRIARDE